MAAVRRSMALLSRTLAVCVQSNRVRSISTLDASRITLSRTPSPKAKTEDVTTVPFGTLFTDHMLRCKWDATDGWDAPAIVPYGPLDLDPSASCLHYGLQCFEGLKAYRGAKGEVRLFRPDMNMARMNNSMSRLYLPTFDGDEMLKCLTELLRVEKDWVPSGDRTSLYVRPTGISTQVFTILSPVGPYYPGGFKPVSLLASTKWVRAWPGGTGNAKVGGNYAGTVMPQATAMDQKYDQVLWLLGDRAELTEVGTMNLFVFWINEDGERELVTPPLDGCILPGVTRQSILDLARGWGDFKVSERKIYRECVVEASRSGRMLEAFGCGTAAVVSPIHHIGFDDAPVDIPLNPAKPDAGIGPLTERFSDALADITYGRVESDWSVVVA